MYVGLGGPSFDIILKVSPLPLNCCSRKAMSVLWILYFQAIQGKGRHGSRLFDMGIKACSRTEGPCLARTLVARVKAEGSRIQGSFQRYEVHSFGGEAGGG